MVKHFFITKKDFTFDSFFLDSFFEKQGFRQIRIVEVTKTRVTGASIQEIPVYQPEGLKNFFDGGLSNRYNFFIIKFFWHDYRG